MANRIINTVCYSVPALALLFSSLASFPVVAHLRPQLPMSSHSGFPDAKQLVLIPHEGAGRVDLEIQAAQEKVKAGWMPVPSMERLGWAYIAKSRESFDPGFLLLAEASAGAIENIPEAGKEAPEALLLRNIRGRSTKEITITRTNQTIQRQVPGFVQVARQGNPLFNEALVAIADKDLYGSTSPAQDSTLFRKYAETPELAALINAIVFSGNGPAIQTGRTDIAGIYIPDLIKVDLSTPPARLAGAGAASPTNPDDAGFSSQSIFGGDTLLSAIQDPFANGGQIPGGWPNGRRFGDDVVDIAVTAIISDLRPNPVTINPAAGIDGVNANDTS